MWTDMKPEADDVILQGRYTADSGDSFWFTIDRIVNRDEMSNMPDTIEFRATVGNLFGSQEVARDRKLESLLRIFSNRMSKARAA